jgi:hypothetical protein
LLERTPDSRALVALDLIPKDVVAHSGVIATPTHDAGPGQAAEEGAAWAAPSRSRDPPGDESRERSQKSLKGLAPARAQKKVQMGPDIRKVVNADAETFRHLAKHLAHGPVVFAQGPRAFGP